MPGTFGILVAHLPVVVAAIALLATVVLAAVAIITGFLLSATMLPVTAAPGVTVAPGIGIQGKAGRDQSGCQDSCQNAFHVFHALYPF